MGTHGRELRGYVTVQVKFIVHSAAVSPDTAPRPPTSNQKGKKASDILAGTKGSQLALPSVPSLPIITFEEDDAASPRRDAHTSQEFKNLPSVTSFEYHQERWSGNTNASTAAGSVYQNINANTSNNNIPVTRGKPEAPAPPRLRTQTSVVRDLVNTEAMGSSVRLARGLVSAVMMLWKEGCLDPETSPATNPDPEPDAGAVEKLSLVVVQPQDSFTSKFVKQSARTGAAAVILLKADAGAASAAATADSSIITGVGASSAMSPTTRLTYALKADASSKQPRKSWIIPDTVSAATAAGSRVSKLAKPAHRKTASKVRGGRVYACVSGEIHTRVIE